MDEPPIVDYQSETPKADAWDLTAVSHLVRSLRAYLQSLRATANGMTSPPKSYQFAKIHLGRFGVWLAGVDNEEIALQEVLMEDQKLADAVLQLVIQLSGYIMAQYSDGK